MFWCGDQHEGLHADDLDAEPVGRVGVGQTDDGSVVFVASQVLDERDGVLFSQRHLDSGVVVVERRQQAGEVDVGDAGDGAEAEPSGDDALQSGQGCSCRVGGAERVVCMGEEGLAGGGEAGGLGGSVEELLAEFSFESADLLTDARLGHVEALGGAGEALLAGDSNEVGELA
jgi:hypothetical protein